MQKTLDDRVMYYNQIYDSKKMELLSAGICPNCGGKLKERDGKLGKFMGCSNYPHCRFTVTIDIETGEIIIKS